jgi:hypothetical protein
MPNITDGLPPEYSRSGSGSARPVALLISKQRSASFLAARTPQRIGFVQWL